MQSTRVSCQDRGIWQMLGKSLGGEENSLLKLPHLQMVWRLNSFFFNDTHLFIGPLEMREIIRNHARIGVDQIKLSMSGEEAS